MEKRKHSVLFVDVDPVVLQGLKSSLERFNDYWNTDFASSAQEALDKLSDMSFDVIITDMHMPAMDGMQFLEVVSRERPDVLRFVLCGNTSDMQVLKSTQLAHQMIPKPYAMEHLYEVVERACRLREMLTDPHLLRIITGIKTLPSVPILYNRLLKELQSGYASSQSVGNIIAQDTAMTAKVLQLVNSAFFGLPENISSPQRAVTILGLNTIKALVLGIQVFSEFKGKSNIPISIDSLWRHSLLVSSQAYQIARSLNLNVHEQEYARVSGILHDIGRLMLFKIPDIFQKVQFSKSGMIPVESEYKVLGTSHAEMGAYLLGIWGLPNPIVEATTFHHRPGAQLLKNADLITAVYTANGLVNMCQHEKEIRYEAYLDMKYIGKADVIKYLDEWTASVRDLMQSAK